MRRGSDLWRLRGLFGEVEIDLRPASPDAEARQTSVGLLRLVLDDARLGRPEPARTLREVLARLGGRAYGSNLRGSSQVDAIAGELLAAARAGLVVARRLERRAVAIPVEAPPSEALGPQSSSDEAPPSKSWVGIVLVDQDGTPLPGRAYRIKKPDGTVLDGTLDSNGAAMIKDLDPGNCQIWCPYVPPRPETTYAVQAGDHASGIAQSFGFDDFATVWNDPGNADLQQQRADPHVLQPGDQLTVPEIKDQPGASKPTGAKHQFQINVSPLKLRLTLLDLLVKPMKSTDVTVDGTALTTDGSGLVEATVDKSAKDAALVIPSGQVDLVLGGLDPSDDATERGYKARLFNLGFLWNATVDDADDEMVIALQDFQAQYSLKVSGELDDATKGKLVEAHGC